MDRPAVDDASSVRTAAASVLELLQRKRKILTPEVNQELVICPACSSEVASNKINDHLDKQCTSFSKSPLRPQTKRLLNVGNYWKETAAGRRDFPAGEERRKGTRIIDIYAQPLSRRGTNFTGKRLKLDDAADVDWKSPIHIDIPNRCRYYHRHFLQILEAVFAHRHNCKLFTSGELDHVKKLLSASGVEQRLFIRLMGRKPTWFRLDNLKYDELLDQEKLDESEKGFVSITGIVERLCERGLLSKSYSIDDLEDLLKTLSKKEMGKLAQGRKLSPGVNKGELTRALITHHRKQGTFTTGSSQVPRDLASMLGTVVAIPTELKDLFSRIRTLFSLNFENDELAPSILVMEMKNRVVYPKYAISLGSEGIFLSRSTFREYHSAMVKRLQMEAFIFEKKFDEALILLAEARMQLWDGNDLRCSLVETVLESPFLRRFHAGEVYMSMLTIGAEVFERLHRWSDACDLYEQMIKQHIFGHSYRGKWYDRISINLKDHLNHHHESAMAIVAGLRDPVICTSRRLALQKRLQRLRSKYPFASDLCKENESLFLDMRPYRKREFIGEAVLGNIRSLKANYIFDDCLGSVEEFALWQYARDGWAGIHCENALLHHLFSVALWDILFMPVDGVFISKYQVAPLDLATEAFYFARQEAIDARLRRFREGTNEIKKDIERQFQLYSSHNGASANWDRFSLEFTLTAVDCIGAEVLTGVFTVLCRDYRHMAGGLPDLFLWKSKENEHVFVEVKGPGDRLSEKQRLWLDILAGAGGTVEVCLVKTVESR
eukprot:Clim_evm25s55 gene=Clim_evmTU25s55